MWDAAAAKIASYKNGPPQEKLGVGWRGNAKFPLMVSSLRQALIH